MKRWSALPFVAAVLLFGPGSAQSGASPTEVTHLIEEAIAQAAARVRPAVLTLEVDGRDDDTSAEPGGTGQGSGIVIDPRGLVLTNHHVIDGAASIKVIWRDGARSQARVVGFDEQTDIALLRLDPVPPDLVAAELGDSDALRIGQFAIAIGSPLGLSDSVSVGHLSATGRRTLGMIGDLVDPEFAMLRHQDFLQIDTPIHPGNSGGPLVDIEGRVIGLNTAIMGHAGGGLGFAIPINLARVVAGEIETHGRVRRAWLGLQVGPLSPGFREAFELPAERGLLILEVQDGSPADEAGLISGDVLLNLDGEAIDDEGDLLGWLAARRPGSSVDAELLRVRPGGTAASLRVQLTLTERTVSSTAEGATPPSGADLDAEHWLDAVVGLDLDAAAKGRRPALRVDHVTPGTPASEAGLRPGDLLLEVGQRPVRSADDVRSALLTAPRRYVPVLVDRSGAFQPLAIARP